MAETHIPYRDDVDLEITSISDHEVPEEEEDEGQLMLGAGSKTEPTDSNRCRKCPYILLVLILLIAAGVGYVNKNDIDIDLAMVKKVLHINTCSVHAKTIKLESTTGSAIQMFEVQLFSNGVNIAHEGLASQSSTLKTRTADAAVDENVSSFSHTALDDNNAWWTLEFKEAKQLEKLTILNRFCQGPNDPTNCFCRLSYAKISFINESGETVLTDSFGDTCHEAQLDLDFTSCNKKPEITMENESDEEEGILIADTYEPTYFPSKEPAATAVSTPLPSFNPTYTPTKTTTIHESNPTEASASIKQLQITNYIAGTGLILNIHITHHAGTAVCSKMTECGPTPSFACMKQKTGDGTPWPDNDPNLNRFSLTYDDSEVLVTVFRPYFHYMSMEYPRWGNLHNFNWEYPKLTSMIVMRHPLDRFLAGGKCGEFHKTIINEADPDSENEEVQRLYWEYANAGCADNYALRVLAGSNRCDEKNMEDCFQSAKSLLERFTFILDEECLDESMEAMGNQLGMHITANGFESKKHHYHKTAQERINNETLYEFLLDRFHYDIELYEWSKEMSVLRCSELAQYEIDQTTAPTTATGESSLEGILGKDSDEDTPSGGGPDEFVEEDASGDPTYFPSKSPS